MALRNRAPQAFHQLNSLFGVSCYSTKLGNSMSDGFYDREGAPAVGEQRPHSKDSRVVEARTRQSSIIMPGDETLHNSLSDGFYASSQRRRIMPSSALSSVSDPISFWSGTSFSEGYYEAPAALRAGLRNRSSKTFFSAGPRSLPLMHRISAQTNTRPPPSIEEEGKPLHNSMSHSGY